MLKVFRQRKRFIKLLFWGIVVVVGFMMVVTLVPGLGGGAVVDPLNVVATIGPRQLTAEEVTRRLALVQSRQGQLNPFFRRILAQQVIDEMIFLRAVEAETQRLGLRVTREEVWDEIRQLPDFQRDGKFIGVAELERMLQPQRITLSELEEEMRMARLLGKLYQLLTDGLTVSDAEIEQEFRARNEKVTVEYVLFKPRTLEDQLKPTEEELRAFFATRRDRYQLPDRRRARYVLVGFDWVGQRLPVTREELESYYRRNLESYRVPEQVRFSRILFRFPENATDKQKEEVRSQARQVHAELARGRDFATLAKKHSDDKDAAEKGGDAGWVTRGQVPELESLLFSLPKGAAGGPVEVAYGIHIVRVSDRQQAHVKPLEEIRGEIEPFLTQQKNQQEALRLAQRLVAEVRGGSPAGAPGKTLAAAAEAHGLRVAETPLFGLTGSLPDFPGNTAVQEAAFRLKKEEVSDPVSVPQGYVVVQMMEEVKARSAELADVRDQVERAFRQERAAELARQHAQALAEAARKSSDLRTAARSAGVEVKLSSPFTRTDTVPALGPAREFSGKVFTAPLGSIVGPERVGVNWAVMRVAARHGADLKNLQNERGLIEAQLLVQKRQMTLELFRESLLKRLSTERELRINQAAIDRILGTR